MHTSHIGLIVRCTSILAAALALSLPARSEEPPMLWQFYEREDEASAGNKLASLILGIPETDAVQVTGECRQAEAGDDALADMVFGTDTGTLKDGEWVDLVVTAAGTDHVVRGRVHGTKLEVGVTGVSAKLGFNDALWTLMQDKEELGYRIKGEAASNLKLKGGHSTIRRFIETCKGYSGTTDTTSSSNGSSAQKRARTSASTALLAAKRSKAAEPATDEKATEEIESEDVETPKSGSPSTSLPPEKDAFESAKELGTLEAWEAFLTRYPDGFYGDLARAYVRKIGAAPAPGSTEKPPPKQSQPAAKPAAAENFSMLDVGPGTEPWRTTTYVMDEGNASAKAAAVSAGGVELLFFCNAAKRLSGILRQSDDGAYPKFDARIEQGLAEIRRRSGNRPDAYMRMQFSNDNAYSVSAAVQELNGEVLLGYLSKDGGFNPAGNLIEDLMAAKTVRLAAPPFGATFQLIKSRDSICSVVSSCGATAPGCANATSAPKKTNKAKKSSGSRCGSGKVWLEGKCINRNEVAAYCGPGYRRKGSKCVPGAYQAPKNPPQYDKRCPPGMIWELGGCTEND